MTQENLEPQTEMQEILEEQPQEEAQEEQATEETQEETTEETQEEKPEVDFNDPKIKEAVRIQREKDQEAVNKRIAKEVGRRKASENRFSELEKRFEDFEKKFTKPAQKPKIEDFEDPNDFVKASMDYQMKSQPRQPQQQQPSPTIQQFAVKEQEYAKSHPGYYDKVENLKPFTQHNPNLLDAIFESGPEMADFLADNIRKVDEISQLPPVLLGREIAKLENEFKRSKPLPKKANPKPRPVSESRGTTTSANLADMDQAQYNRYMLEQTKQY